MNLTRDQRVDRQRLDDGDPDDSVYIGSGESEAYHERPDCGLLSDADETTRAAAQRRWRAPCQRCCLDGGDRR